MTTFALPALSLFGIELDYTLRNVILGSAILGVVGGVLGSFAVLRRQSLVGDALAHAALPGVCAAFMLTGSKTPLALMTGAALSGWLATLALQAIVRGSRVKPDAALGIVLSVSFGFGILLLTRIQHSGDAGQSGLDRFLFGQASTIVADDVRTMAVLGGAALGLVGLLFKEFKVLTFDPDFAAVVGYPTGVLTVLLSTLVVVAVVIGLQTVGVVLMVAMLVAPAAAARQWTNRLGAMLALAGALGALSGVVGAVLSSRIERLPTGPTIVLVATAFVAASVLFAPERGVLWAEVRRRRHARSLWLARLLRALAEDGTAGSAPPALAPVAVASAGTLARGTNASPRAVAGGLRVLARKRLVRPAGDGRWALTAAGAERAAGDLRRERIWKGYLANQMDLPADAVHLGLDEIERLLPPEVVRQLDAGETPAARTAGSGRGHEGVLAGGRAAGRGGEL